MKLLRKFAVALFLVSLFGSTTYSQSGLERLIGGVANELLDRARNDSRRTGPDSVPGESGSGPRQMRLPDESGRTPGTTRPRYGGEWGIYRPPSNPTPRIQPQPQPQPQPQGQGQYERVYNPATRQYEYRQRTTYPQTTYPRPQNSYPQGTIIRETPRSSTPSIPTVPAEVGNGQPITITVPRTQPSSCGFTLLSGDSQFPRTLNPGQMQPLKGSSSVWYIRYNEKRGTKKYRLRGGEKYVFQKQSDGFWQLYKQPKEVAEEPPLLPQ